MNFSYTNIQLKVTIDLGVIDFAFTLHFGSRGSPSTLTSLTSPSPPICIRGIISSICNNFHVYVIFVHYTKRYLKEPAKKDWGGMNWTSNPPMDAIIAWSPWAMT
jgi:hypothetical protein